MLFGNNYYITYTTTCPAITNLNERQILFNFLFRHFKYVEIN